MPRGLTHVLAAGGSLLAAALLWGRGALGTRRLFEQAVARLAAPTPAKTRIAFADTPVMPPPVDRYMRKAMQDGQPLIRRMTLAQRGRLRTDSAKEKWFSFDARQVASPAAPGFAWNARVALPGGLHLRVLDTYAQGRGAGHVRLLSAIPIGKDGNRPPINSGALHRYLAEAVWYPTALLPGPHLRWSPIDDHRALASLSDHGLSVSLEFRFNPDDDVVGIYTPARWGRFGTEDRQVAWEGHFTRHVVRDGLRVPLRGDVGWYTDGTWKPVFFCDLSALTYEFYV